MAPLIVLPWLFTALLLVLVIVAREAGAGSIPLNRWVGIRIAPLKRDDAAWRAGHAAAVAPAVVAFAVSLVSAVVGIVVPAAGWGSIVAFVGGIVWIVVRAAAAADAATPRAT